jgi:hypothetical protein
MTTHVHDMEWKVITGVECNSPLTRFFVTRAPPSTGLEIFASVKMTIGEVTSVIMEKKFKYPQFSSHKVTFPSYDNSCAQHGMEGY